MKRAPKKRWVVYLVRCRDGSLYTGITNDLARRLDAHNAGTGARYTRARRPVELAYHEPAKSKGAALRREYAIKQLRVALKRALVGKSVRRSVSKAVRK